MDRRRFVSAAVATGLVGAGGCLGLTGGDGEEIKDSDDDGVIDSEDYAPEDSEVQERSDLTGGDGAASDSTMTASEESPTRTQTRTRTQTETPTESRGADPEVQAVNLVYRWEEFADAVDNAIDASAPGMPILIAFRYTANVSGGKSEVTEQVEVRNSDGRRVGSKISDTRALTDRPGENVWEHALFLRTAGWERGTYTASVIIRDQVTGQGSEKKETEFELRRPLFGRDVSVVSVDAPRTVRVGEPYSFTITMRNESARDGGFRSTMSARGERSDWRKFSTPLELALPSEGTNRWQSGEVSFDTTGELTYRIDELNYTWNLDIME